MVSGRAAVLDAGVKSIKGESISSAEEVRFSTGIQDIPHSPFCAGTTCSVPARHVRSSANSFS